MNTFDKMTLCLLIANRFMSSYNMIDVAEYINENYKNIDCYESKKNFLLVGVNNSDLKSVLTEFVVSKLKFENIDEKDSVSDDVIAEGLDYFFNIEYTDDNTAIIEPEIYD